MRDTSPTFTLCVDHDPSATTSRASPAIAVMRAFSATSTLLTEPLPAAVLLRTATREKRSSSGFEGSISTGLDTAGKVALPGEGALATWLACARPALGGELAAVAWLELALVLPSGEDAGSEAMGTVPALYLLRFDAGVASLSWDASARGTAESTSSEGCLSRRAPGKMARSLAVLLRVVFAMRYSSSNSVSLEAWSSFAPTSCAAFGRTTSKISGGYEVAFAGAATLPKIPWWMARLAAYRRYSSWSKTKAVCVMESTMRSDRGSIVQAGPARPPQPYSPEQVPLSCFGWAAWIWPRQL
mmetsp:Transcript_70929/g.178859  ORF Transcript_70929/g.178859 Transcript_70929/m.178859 type:complete len:300 (-) Transcript_70929:1427-2326(-)